MVRFLSVGSAVVRRWWVLGSGSVLGPLGQGGHPNRNPTGAYVHALHTRLWTARETNCASGVTGILRGGHFVAAAGVLP